MNFQRTLDGSKKEIDKELQKYFDILTNDVRKYDSQTVDALEQVRKIALAGGKRIRGILLQSAYFGVGGRDKRKILKAAVAVELLHLFFLIHDDVIDHGDLRHGEETIHNFFAKKKSRRNDRFESEHFGNSIAIIIGDMLFAKANELILKAGFGERETLSALVYLQGIVTTTIIGQSQDISIGRGEAVDEKDVLVMYENKTARYTFEFPLRTGLILAGLSDKKIQNIFSQYAMDIGVAFQLQDDMLGIFGERKKIGKSTISDIEEGKFSLMVVYAMANADAGDRKALSEILGKKNANQKEVRRFKDILRDSGAKEYARSLAEEYFMKAGTRIEKAVLLPQSKKFLTELVGYLKNREI